MKKGEKRNGGGRERTPPPIHITFLFTPLAAVAKHGAVHVLGN